MQYITNGHDTIVKFLTWLAYAFNHIEYEFVSSFSNSSWEYKVHGKMVKWMDKENIFIIFVKGRGERPSHLLYEISFIVINATGINSYSYYFQDLVLEDGKVLNYIHQYMLV